MENLSNQEANENLYLCFQKTPSLHRKWRKRYGGLDGNKLLEPNKEKDRRENGVMTDAVSERNAAPVKSAVQTRFADNIADNIAKTVPRKAVLSHRPVNFAVPVSTAFNSNVGTKVLQAEPEQMLFAQLWTRISKTEAQQSKKKTASDVLFDSFATEGKNSVFAEETQKLFNKCKQLSSVQERKDRSKASGKWGVSVCTVGGQRLSLGDWNEPCVLGEIAWPLVYGLAVDQSGIDHVHRYVGVEEYAKYEAPFTLSEQGVPHTPLTETGAIICASILQQLTLSQVTEEEEKYESTSMPAKSSSSGVVLIVVPGVLGITSWSPELDAYGNSWRAVHFSEELVSVFQLHSFDIRTSFRQVLSYSQWKVESEGYQIMNILLAAYQWDLHSLRRYFLSGSDVNAVDYDGRSALHVAASEGRLEVIKFLMESTGAICTLKDRCGNGFAGS